MHPTFSIEQNKNIPTIFDDQYIYDNSYYDGFFDESESNDYFYDKTLYNDYFNDQITMNYENSINIKIDDINQENIEYNLENCQRNDKYTIRKKNPKRKVVLSESAFVFKNYYFSIFTKKKKFPKRYVKMIHNFMMGFLDLPKMTRDEIRCSDLYFQNYEPQQIQILSFLRKNREIIFSRYLLDINKKKNPKS